jgi:hypothetical protein
MNEFFRTAIYRKNVPSAERALRLLAAVATGVATAMYFSSPLLKGLGVMFSVMFALTGAFGFCPACYMAGRKLPGQTA